MQKIYSIIKKVTLFENIEDSDMLVMLKCLGARIHSYKRVKFLSWQEIRFLSVGIVLKWSSSCCS